MPSLLETDLNNRFGQKKENPIRISYDLLPSGKVENFEVTEVDEWYYVLASTQQKSYSKPPTSSMHILYAYLI